MPPLRNNMPAVCPRGHRLLRGEFRLSWTPCICGPAREAAEAGRGMGHHIVICNQCHEELWHSRYFEPPRDVSQRTVR